MRNFSKNALANYAYLLIMITSAWFINPYLLIGLGTLQFGIWKSTQKLIELACGFDGGAIQGLKWYTASNSTSNPSDNTPNYFIVARNTLLRWLPFMLFLVSLIAVYVAVITGEIRSGSRQTIFVAVLLTGIVSVFGLFAQLYESITIGMGFGYKTLLIRGPWLLVSNILMGLAANSIWGLFGVAVVFSLNILVTSIGLMRLAKINLSRPLTNQKEDRQEFRSYGKRILIWEFAQRYLVSWEMVLFIFCGLTEQISAYVFSTFIFQFGLAATMQTFSAITPRISSIYSTTRHHEIYPILDRIRKITLFITVNVMLIISIFNERLVESWVGSDQYFGKEINIYFVVCFLQLVLLRVDSQLLESTREIRERMISSVAILLLGSISSFLMYFFTKSLSASLFVLFLARSLLIVYFFKLVSSRFKGAMWKPLDLSLVTILFVVVIVVMEYLPKEFRLELLVFMICAVLSGLYFFSNILRKQYGSFEKHENGN
jgi:O-antigen/teichoic acid export membrane protein